MAKISIYLEDHQLKDLDYLVKNATYLSKRNRSALLSYLLERESAKQKREEMLAAAAVVDELNIGWSEGEQNCAIIDAEVSG
jgi:metal-responsive CopG/Arc/MetJ family transcriptional regulator